MEPSVELRIVDHRNTDVAEQLHAVQMLAYAQEARLLGVRRFPPLERTAGDIRDGAERFWAACIGSRIVGAIGVESNGDGREHTIASLVVIPEFQGRGIGARLLAAVLAEQGREELTVQTAARNVPALALYASAGFVEVRRWHVGPEALELVMLRRPAAGKFPTGQMH